MDELKPCPFCGGELMFCPSHVEGQYIINKPGGVCKKCGMKFIELGYRVYGEVKSEDFNDEKFFERWNTRPAEDALKTEVERLKVDLDARNSALKIAFHDIKRAGEEIDKWKKMFYDLINKQASVSTEPKVIVVGKDTNVPTKESEGKE